MTTDALCGWGELLKINICGCTCTVSASVFCYTLCALGTVVDQAPVNGSHGLSYFL